MWEAFVTPTPNADRHTVGAVSQPHRNVRILHLSLERCLTSPLITDHYRFSRMNQEDSDFSSPNALRIAWKSLTTFFRRFLRQLADVLHLT